MSVLKKILELMKEEERLTLEKFYRVSGGGEHYFSLV